MKFTGKIEKGVIKLDNPEFFAIEKSKLEGQRITLSLEKLRPHRSNNQNAYLFGIVMPLLCEHLGYKSSESYELWEAIKLQVGHTKTINGVVIPASSNNLSTTDFEQLMTKVRTWASVELQCFIPLPNEENII